MVGLARRLKESSLVMHQSLNDTEKQEESDVGLPGGNGQLLTLGLGLLATALAAAYVTRLAKVISL